jgi:hypothetical protein
MCLAGVEPRVPHPLRHRARVFDVCHPALGPPRLPQAPDPHPFSPPSWHACFVNDHIVHWSILQASSEPSINVTSMKVTLGAALALGR